MGCLEYYKLPAIFALGQRTTQWKEQAEMCCGQIPLHEIQ